MTLHVHSPTNDTEAIDLLMSSPVPLDSPTQHRFRTETHLLDAFGSGRRRPEWVWAVCDDARSPLGVIAALGADEVAVYAPPGTTYDAPDVQSLREALSAAGWRLFVERRHYEFEAGRLGDDQPSTGLRFTRVTDASDPVECIHVARNGFGDVVGMVSGRVLPTGRGFVLFVGVARDHRGHGYGRELLAWQTRQLLDDGANRHRASYPPGGGTISARTPSNRTGRSSDSFV